MADPKVAYWLGGPFAADEIDRRFERMRRTLDAEGWGVWAIEGPDGELEGAAGLQPVAAESGLPFAPAVEAAWRLRRSAWGKGYVTQAMRQVLDRRADWLEGEDVVAFTATTNARSRAVMERLGFSHDAAEDFDHPALASDHPLQRHVLYRLPAA